jgi:shikimate dehydrogenase
MGVAGSLFQAAFLAAGSATRCQQQQVGPENLSEAVRLLRSGPSVIGASVGMPDTVAIVPLLDGLGPEAQTIKAVNTITHKAGALIGWNTDRAAFAQALDDAAFPIDGRAALVLGAGGAARACVDVLRQTASKLWVSAPDLEQARGVCRDLEVNAGGPAALGGLSLLIRKVDLIVNATPVGSDGKGLLFPLEWITPSHFVFDLIYQPALTPLVRGARERGARALNGLSMLLFQAIGAFEIWCGQAAPEPAMRASLERAVIERLGS